jgi:hypothetical protein
MSELGRGPGWGRFWSYVGAAFKQHWNLLLFGGATAAALISPAPDVLVPLVLAGELTYLTGLAGHPRFRSWVDRKQAEAARGPETSPATPPPSIDALLATLPKASQKRFADLKARGAEMLRLTAGIRAATSASGVLGEQTPAMNRMLWMFLRLLISEAALDRFLGGTDEATLDAQMADLRQRASGKQQDPRILRSLTDSIATLELRRQNLAQARTNRELVELELNRIESQLQALGEMGISLEDPEAITQLGTLSRGFDEAEASLGELSRVPGLEGFSSEAAPQILELEREDA